MVQPEQYNPARDDGNGISYVYDCHDHVIQVIGPDGELLQENTYNLSEAVETAETGGKIFERYEYDLTGNPTAFYQGKENAQKGISAQRLVYDAWGNVTKAIDGEQNTTEFVLDAWGRITEIHTPEGGTEHYTYDYAGNITSTTDANGGTITYRYNSMGQVHEVIDQEGNGEFLYCDEEGRREMQIDRNGNINRYHYTIDGALSYQRAEDKKGRYPVVNRYMYYPDGSLKEAEGGGIIYCYDYTENGLLKRKSTAKTTAKKLLLEYAYDQNGNLSVLTDGKGKSVYYSYDGLNRLQQVSEGEGKETILAEYSYNLAGQVEKMHYGNGLHTEYSYKDDGNLTSLVTITAQGKVLLNFDYAYDGNGNCIQKSGERYQNTYVYDQMNRLVEAAYDGKQERYTYDLAGNRLKKESEQGTEIYHYNVKNQLTHVHNKEGEIKYHYDVQGNLLEEQGSYWKKQYTYDAANHQRSVAIENQKPDKGREHLFQQNQYDAEGLRYEVEENGKIHYFLFDREELAEESQEDSSIRYLRGYQPIALENSKDKEYFVQDEAGNTLFLLDKDHEIQKTYRYDAFGIILKETGSDGELSNRLTYTGQMLDCATGQYYLRARFYHPEIGRFMQEDVYRGDGLNLYAYCANNPVMYYDPSGYIGICPKSKENVYKKDKPLEDPKLKKIYDKWISSGISENEAIQYLEKFGNRPDVEFLPYIDKLAIEAYQNVLSKKDYGLSRAQIEKATEKPFLYPMYVGSEVDKEFKRLLQESPNIPKDAYYITKIGLEGEDLIFRGVGSPKSDYILNQKTGEMESVKVWVDLTTQKDANAHFYQYKGNGYVAPYR